MSTTLADTGERERPISLLEIEWDADQTLTGSKGWPQSAAIGRPSRSQAASRMLEKVLLAMPAPRIAPKQAGCSALMALLGIHPATRVAATDTHEWSGMLVPSSLSSEEPPQRGGLAAYLLHLASKILAAEILPARQVAPSLQPQVAARAIGYMAAHPNCPLPALVFAAMVQPITSVERIICEELNDAFMVWTIVNQATEEERYAIYGCEWEVLRIFHRTTVEFNVVDRDGSPLEDFAEWGEHPFIIEV